MIAIFLSGIAFEAIHPGILFNFTLWQFVGQYLGNFLILLNCHPERQDGDHGPEQDPGSRALRQDVPERVGGGEGEADGAPARQLPQHAQQGRERTIQES